MFRNNILKIHKNIFNTKNKINWLLKHSYVNFLNFIIWIQKINFNHLSITKSFSHHIITFGWSLKNNICIIYDIKQFCDASSMFSPPKEALFQTSLWFKFFSSQLIEHLKPFWLSFCIKLSKTNLFNNWFNII